MIKHLLERKKASFPKLGRIFKGDPKPNATTPGKDREYFRFESDDGAAKTQFFEVYGDKPEVINVLLPFPKPDDNFEAWMEHWSAGGLVHRCDGETTVLLRDGDSFDKEPHPCPGGCKQAGRLNVVIPELLRLGYVTVGTTSKWDIMELYSNIVAAYEIRGNLQGIPFLLKRTPRPISIPPIDLQRGSPTYGQRLPNGKRSRSVKWLLSLEPDPKWIKQYLLAAKAAAVPTIATREALMLPAASDEDLENDDNLGQDWNDNDQQDFGQVQNPAQDEALLAQTDGPWENHGDNTRQAVEPKPAVVLAETAQIDKISELLTAICGEDKACVKAHFQKHSGAESSRSITSDQAADYIKRLEAEVATLRKAQAAIDGEPPWDCSAENRLAILNSLQFARQSKVAEDAIKTAFTFVNEGFIAPEKLRNAEVPVVTKALMVLANEAIAATVGAKKTKGKV